MSLISCKYFRNVKEGLYIIWFFPYKVHDDFLTEKRAPNQMLDFRFRGFRFRGYHLMETFKIIPWFLDYGWQRLYSEKGQKVGPLYSFWRLENLR